MNEFYNLLDTILNMSVFAFVGCLIWLYLRKDDGSDQ